MRISAEDSDTEDTEDSNEGSVTDGDYEEEASSSSSSSSEDLSHKKLTSHKIQYRMPDQTMQQMQWVTTS